MKNKENRVIFNTNNKRLSPKISLMTKMKETKKYTNSIKGIDFNLTNTNTSIITGIQTKTNEIKNYDINTSKNDLNSKNSKSSLPNVSNFAEFKETYEKEVQEKIEYKNNNNKKTKESKEISSKREKLIHTNLSSYSQPQISNMNENTLSIFNSNNINNNSNNTSFNNKDNNTDSSKGNNTSKENNLLNNFITGNTNKTSITNQTSKTTKTTKTSKTNDSNMKEYTKLNASSTSSKLRQSYSLNKNIIKFKTNKKSRNSVFIYFKKDKDEEFNKMNNQNQLLRSFNYYSKERKDIINDLLTDQLLTRNNLNNSMEEIEEINKKEASFIEIRGNEANLNEEMNFLNVERSKSVLNANKKNSYKSDIDDLNTKTSKDNLKSPIYKRNINATNTFSIKEIIDDSEDEEEMENFRNSGKKSAFSSGFYEKTKDVLEIEAYTNKLIDQNAISNLIFDINYDKIKSLLTKIENYPEFISKLINTPDLRKIHPLFLCINLRESLRNKNREEDRKTLLDIIKLFIKYSVRIRIRNEDKRTPLEESVANNDREVVEVIYDRALINKENKIKFSKDKANAFLIETPDFYVEMKWEVNVPLLSFLCPNDTCKIWKQGNMIRMDYTFIDMKNLSCIRAPTSFIYDGKTGETYLVNWETKKWFNQFEPLDEEEKELILNDIMEGNRLNSEFKLKNCNFIPSLNWRNKPVFEKIHSYLSQKYNVKVGAYFDLHHHVKIEHTDFENKKKYFDEKSPLNKKVILINPNDVAKKKLADNLHLKNDMAKKQLENFGKTKDKNLNAMVWIAENYPFKLAYMINMVNSLSNANEFIEKLKEFFKDPEFQSILDKGGFPIKIKIPINFFIDVTMTFTKYEELTNKDLSDKFIIPSTLTRIPRKDAQDLKNNFKKRLKYININL